MKRRLAQAAVAALDWEPGPRARHAVLAAGFVAIMLTGAAHYATGLRYEFHTFYLLPVMAVSWYAGARAGFVAALFSAADWLLMDWLLARGEMAWGVVTFNELVRLSVFLVVNALVARLKAHLRQEATLARTDALTQLANRRLFYDEGRAELERARRGGAALTVLFIDLDDFKRVNDTLGHHVGDEVLRAVAETLRDGTRVSDLVARLGGDEFAVLMPETDARAAESRARDLHARLLRRLAGTWPVHVSMGVTTCASAPPDFETLVRRADALMYEVKLAGKNAIRFGSA